MLIETMRLTHTECEGYAVRIDGGLVFEYFTQYDTLEAANLEGDHQDVLALGALLNTVYMEGVATDGQGDVNLIRHETSDREEYFEFALEGEPCDS